MTSNGGKGMMKSTNLTLVSGVEQPETDAQIISRIERFIREMPENSRVFTITPGVAQYLFDNYNTSNRTPKPSKIAEYAEDMNEQLWKRTGDTVKFSDKGRLRDGQNRLLACIRSGASFRTHVVFGIEDEAFLWMDRGKPRTGADGLFISGVKDTTKVAAALRWLCLIDHNRIKQRDTFRPAQIEQAYRDRDAESLAVAVRTASHIYRVDRSPVGLVAALVYKFSEINVDRAAEFTDAWVSGRTGGKFTSIGKLQSAVHVIKQASSGRIHDVVRAALIVTAWNLFLAGKKGVSTDFYWVPSMDFPAIRRR